LTKQIKELKAQNDQINALKETYKKKIDKLEKQAIRKEFELKKAKEAEPLRYKAKYNNLKKDVEAMKELNKIKFEKLSQSRNEYKKKWQKAVAEKNKIIKRIETKINCVINAIIKLDDKKLIQEIINSLQEVFDSNFYNQIVSGVEDAMKA
ncbi:2460_t:CDS:2, partial [Gigaspora margarita]